MSQEYTDYLLEQRKHFLCDLWLCQKYFRIGKNFLKHISYRVQLNIYIYVFVSFHFSLGNSRHCCMLFGGNFLTGLSFVGKTYPVKVFCEPLQFYYVRRNRETDRINCSYNNLLLVLFQQYWSQKKEVFMMWKWNI